MKDRYIEFRSQTGGVTNLVGDSRGRVAHPGDQTGYEHLPAARNVEAAETEHIHDLLARNLISHSVLIKRF